MASEEPVRMLEGDTKDFELTELAPDQKGQPPLLLLGRRGADSHHSAFAL